jgi:hypothetical protein
MKKLLSIIALTFILSTAVAQQQKAKADTTKPAATYVLLGALQNFQLLLAAITTPGDVTPNQMRELAEWISKNTQPIPAADSTKRK